MKKVKAYTLIEILIVMTVMIIVLAVGITSYVAFIETTKYNQDVANVEHDILTMQRASMLFKKKPDDGWLYGMGIDFGGVKQGKGTYRYFKWCSGYDNFGPARTAGKYPNYDSTLDTSFGIANGIAPITDYGKSSCSTYIGASIGDAGGIAVAMTGYGTGILNLGEDVRILGDGRFLLFESVTGRAFIFDDYGNLYNDDLYVMFSKGRGTTNILSIEELTGRTKLSDIHAGHPAYDLYLAFDPDEPVPLPEDPEPLPEEPEPLPEDPEPLPEDPEPLPEDPEPLPEDPEPLPEDPEPLPEDPGPLPGDPCFNPGDCEYIDPVEPPTYEQ